MRNQQKNSNEEGPENPSKSVDLKAEMMKKVCEKGGEKQLHQMPSDQAE